MSHYFYAGPEIKAALRSGHIVIDHLQGGSNLAYKVSQYKALLCNVLGYMDHDAAALNAFEKARAKGLLSLDEITFATCRGMKESEIEDVIAAGVYVDAIRQHFGVELKGNLFRNNRKKWSRRVADVFQNQGKPWNETVEAQVRSVVADLVAQSPGESLNRTVAGSIKALVKAVKSKLNL